MPTKGYPYVKGLDDSVIIEFGPDIRVKLSHKKAHELVGLLSMVLPAPK